MQQTDNHQSGQTLVEYGILVFLVVVVVASVFLLIPASLVYLYMRTRHADRRTAFLVAVGFTLLIGLLNAYLARSRQGRNCAKTRCCARECDCCDGECSCCSENCQCAPTEEAVAETV
jgi:hypothetical protein